MIIGMRGFGLAHRMLPMIFVLFLHSCDDPSSDTEELIAAEEAEAVLEAEPSKDEHTVSDRLASIAPEGAMTAPDAATREEMREAVTAAATGSRSSVAAEGDRDHALEDVQPTASRRPAATDADNGTTAQSGGLASAAPEGAMTVPDAATREEMRETVTAAATGSRSSVAAEGDRDHAFENRQPAASRMPAATDPDSGTTAFRNGESRSAAVDNGRADETRIIVTAISADMMELYDPNLIRVVAAPEGMQVHVGRGQSATEAELPFEAEYISIHLVSDAFDIEDLTATNRQHIGEDKATWVFKVTPEEYGTHSIQVMATRWVRNADHSYEIMSDQVAKVLDIDVIVSANILMRILQQNFREWIDALVIAILTALGGAIVGFRIGRKS